MSLDRTALRLAAVQALLSHPTLDAKCAGRIYDSRIRDFNHREVVPVIILTTEEAKGEAWSANNGGAPFKAECDLVLEIAMNVVTSMTTKGVAVEVIAAPETDAELEADLDLLEACAIEILTVGQTPQARLLHRAVLRRVPEVKSARFGTDETGEKLAIRLVTLRVEMKNDTPRDARAPLAGPYANLPTPLRTVCEALPGDDYGALICRRIAAALPPVPGVKPPPRIDFAVALDPAAPSSGAPQVAAQFTLDGSP